MLTTRTGEQTARDRVNACVVAVDRDGCFERLFRASAERGDVAATLVALERASLDDCHLLAHGLAHAVYGVVGDVERAFLLGGPQCRMGYLHGSVEASGTAAHGRLSAPRCGAFPRALERLSCAHGFGHALMLHNGHDLRASVRGCSHSRVDERACVLGAMMENSLRYARRVDFVAASARGCRGLGDVELDRLCYDNIGIVAALSVGHDRARAEALCAQLRDRRRRDDCRAGANAEIAEARRRT